MSNDVSYTCGLNGAPLPGAALNVTWQLNIERREFKLKRVLWDLLLYNLLPIQRLPNETQTSQICSLQLTSVWRMASFFLNFSIPYVYNGNQILLYKPGLYEFDSFYTNEILNLTYTGLNGDLLLTITQAINIVITVEYL